MLPTKFGCFEMFLKRTDKLIRFNHVKVLSTSVNQVQCRGKKKNSSSNLTSLFRPVTVKLNNDEDTNVGVELTGELNKTEMLKVLNKFMQRNEIKALATASGIDKLSWQEASNSFRRYCVESKSLPPDLHVVISDIIQGAGNLTDIFPYFMRHAKEIFPHIDCLDDLKKISDLRTPANWYPTARGLTRKIIFHAGPTNSGKTYHALERFMSAKSGVYCGPLKMLAVEVFNKCNENGTPCDLITGEERKYVEDEDHPAHHKACTVEMVDTNFNCEVAVIDEIQTIKDLQRGWAWTRALLGIPANEIHVCGEEAAINLIESLCSTTGEDVEIRKYKRLTELELEDTALCHLSNVEPGDCIVCFSKNDIYTVSRQLERLDKEVAVIYGSLPPGTKLAQAAKFNDVNSSCKILVATDAIGMGLNLHIRRLIFYSLIKPTINEKGEREMDTLSVSSALQIAGRAGRYGTQWEKGYVTTFKSEDLPTLKNLLSQKPDILTQAGLHPTADQIELYAYHLPKAPLSNLLDIFVSLCTVDDSMYFMCNIDDFKFLADMIEHVPLNIKARYIFCCSPINRKLPFVCTMFLKFARQYCKNEPITFDWLCLHIGWPLTTPKNLLDLIHLESVFDVLDLYFWLSYRFPSSFLDTNLVKDMHKELDAVIQEGVFQITKLLKNSETNLVSAAMTAIDEDNFELNAQKKNYLRESPASNDLPADSYKGKLTERLLAQGLITPTMLQELQREWNQKQKKREDERGSRRKFSHRKPKNL